MAGIRMNVREEKKGKELSAAAYLHYWKENIKSIVVIISIFYFISISSTLIPQMAKTPKAVLQCTINDVDQIDDNPQFGKGKGVSLGTLVFELKYYSKKEEGNDPAFLCLFLKCSPTSRNGDTLANNVGWGKYEIDMELQLLKTDNNGRPMSVTKKSTYCKEHPSWGTFKCIEMTTLLNPASNYVVNNQMKIVAKIYSVTPCNLNDEQLDAINLQVTPSSVWEAFLEAGVGADVAFVAEDGTEVKAHSTLLTTASPVFKAMFEAPMKEAQLRKVPLEDMTTANSIQVFLKCLYTGSLSHLYGGGLRVLKEVINAAEKYQLEAMKKGAGAFLLGHISPRNAVGLVQFVKRYGLHEVEMTLRKYIKADMDSIIDNTVAVDSD